MLEIIKLIIKLIFFSFCQVVFISNVTRRAMRTTTGTMVVVEKKTDIEFDGFLACWIRNNETDKLEYFS